MKVKKPECGNEGRGQKRCRERDNKKKGGRLEKIPFLPKGGVPNKNTQKEEHGCEREKKGEKEGGKETFCQEAERAANWGGIGELEGKRRG